MHSPAAYFVIIALLGMQRLHEMSVSRRNCAQLGEGAVCCDPPGNWSAMVVAHIALLALPAAEVAWLGRVAPAVLWWPALALLIASQALRFWTLRTLGPNWNARGLIHPDQAMESGGPYRFAKHPNYLGVAVEVIAIPLAGGAWRSLAVLVVPHAIILFRRIRGEEALLSLSKQWRESMAHKPSMLPIACRSTSTQQS